MVDSTSCFAASKIQFSVLTDYMAFDPERLLYTDNDAATYDVDDMIKVFR